MQAWHPDQTGGGEKRGEEWWEDKENRNMERATENRKQKYTMASVVPYVPGMYFLGMPSLFATGSYCWHTIMLCETAVDALTSVHGQVSVLIYETGYTGGTQSTRWSVDRKA